MCKPRALLAALLLSSLGSSAPAQDARIWRDSVAELNLAARALADSLRTGDSTVVEVSRRDGLVLRASRGIQATAGRALEEFLESKRRWFGGSLPSAGGFRILLRFYGHYSRGSRGGGSLPESLELVGMPDSDAATRVFRGVSRRQLGNADSASSALLSEFGKLMLAKASGKLRLWLHDPLPLHLGERERKLSTMYAFMTGAGASQRACVAGNLPDCGYVLGLRPAVRVDPGGAYPEFLRGDLLLTVLQHGGPTAWERLRLAESKAVADQLAEAAELPLDSLLANWRASLLGVRSTDQPLTVPQAVLTVLWAITLLAGTIGVTRWA